MKSKNKLNLGNLSAKKPFNKRLDLEKDVYKSIKEIPDYERFAILGKKTDFRKRLIREGFDPELLNGKTIGELRDLLDGLVDE